MFFFFKSLQVLQPVLTQLTQLDIVQEKRKLLCLDTYNVVLLFEGLQRKIAECTYCTSLSDGPTFPCSNDNLFPYCSGFFFTILLSYSSNRNFFLDDGYKCDKKMFRDFNEA